MFIMLLLLERTADTACISINNHIVCCYIHSKLNNIYHKIIYSSFFKHATVNKIYPQLS